MCGRYTLTAPPSVLADWLDAVGGVDYPPRYNIAPTQPILVVFNAIDGPVERKAMLMRWGLVPVWVKDPQEFPLIINARSETINEKPAFRGSLRHHRCIIPASGYYEWRKGPDGKKQPYYITMANGEPMAFAGVYSTWLGPDGSEIDTAAIITVPANEDLKHIHDRMPVLIGDKQIDDWLDVHNVSAREADAMLKSAPEGVLAYHPVSTRVNSVRNDDEKLIEQVTEDRPQPPKIAAQGELF